MFGEIALLHKVPRTATVVSKSAKLLLLKLFSTLLIEVGLKIKNHDILIWLCKISAPVDLLLVTRKLFNEYLKDLLLEEWDILRDAIENFNYFKGWNEETMRECCILSKIVNFKPNEVK